MKSGDSTIIRVTDDVEEYLLGKKMSGDSFNDVIRRELGMPPRQKKKPGRKPGGGKKEVSV